jgi:hypothetical protein
LRGASCFKLLTASVRRLDVNFGRGPYHLPCVIVFGECSDVVEEFTDEAVFTDTLVGACEGFNVSIKPPVVVSDDEKSAYALKLHKLNGQ